MTNEMAPKVRLVKCPRCRRLLPEPAGIPIYSCGGCGAILRAKLEDGDAQKKKPHCYAFLDIKDSRNLSHEVAVPSPVEHSPNMQKEEDKDLSSSIQTVSVESNTEEVNEEPDRICSSAEPSSPSPTPNPDPTISTERSANISSSTSLSSHENKELSPTPALYSDANASDENTEFVAVKADEEPKHDGSVKSLETDYPSVPVDSDSTTTTDSCAGGKLKGSEKSAAAEYLDSIPILSTVTGKVFDDGINQQSSNMHVNASGHVPEEITTSISREILTEERFVLQKPSMGRDSFQSYRTMSSKSISSVSGMENSMSEGLGWVRRGHPARFRTRSESDELPPHGWRSQVNSSGSEGPSNQMMRNSLYSSTSCPRERSENILPQDKEKLLRMVIELENQMKRMYNIKEESTSPNFNSHQQFGHQFDHPYFNDPYGLSDTYSSSAQPHDYSPVSWDCETRSGDHMFGFLGLKNSREKTPFPKRHFRPIAGACPLITCYNCSELVQIPEDFLPSGRKRCHQLRCGACSQVLKFSLQDRTHIAPYLPELDEHNNSIHGKKAQGLHLSDDHGIPICKSCSSEGESGPTLFAPTLPSQEDTAGNDTSVSFGSSENFKPGTEEAPRRKGSSALHQLMGYSSVTQLLS